jgi:hypothetical protein
MQVASCLWDRKSGEVTIGQWLKARIFEHRSDLSPDGQHMIIRARRGETNWTALSRAPWLTALSYEAQDGTIGGGGAFTDDGLLWLSGSSAHGLVADGIYAAPTTAFPQSTDGFHMGDTFATTLMARGWDHAGGAGYDIRLSKSLPRGWTLHLRFERGHRATATVLDHVYALSHHDETTQFSDWEWAEPWGKGIQFAANGSLWFAPLSPSGLGEAQVIHDFSEMTFAPRTAPYEGVRA